MNKHFLALMITTVLSVLAFTIGHYVLVYHHIQCSTTISEPELILDAGHGGEDGGAVSLSGISESHINLAIALDMEDILGLYGISPVMLRREDISLHNVDAKNLHQKKVSDLKKRVSIIDSYGGADLISIHQNSYPDKRQHGLQVFYAPTEGSQQLADTIQQRVEKTLQPDNKRDIKQIPETVYLMNHISNRAVLIECGFLTNPQEEELLSKDSYRRKLATILSAAWLTSKSQ